MVYGYIINTNNGYVMFNPETNEIWMGGSNCVIAVFEDRAKARYIAKKLKRDGRIL